MSLSDIRLVFINSNLGTVSILVLMDESFRRRIHKDGTSKIYVSILVLMDESFRQVGYSRKDAELLCFHPCFNG